MYEDAHDPRDLVLYPHHPNRVEGLGAVELDTGQPDLIEFIADFESRFMRTESDTTANPNALFVWNIIRERAGLPRLNRVDLTCACEYSESPVLERPYPVMPRNTPCMCRHTLCKKD